MNNRRILQLPSLETYLCTIQSILQLTELSYCLFLGNVKHCTTPSLSIKLDLCLFVCLFVRFVLK